MARFTPVRRLKHSSLIGNSRVLFLFMLPKYCSEMNEIETEWHQLKAHEIAGQMFDNEYDLALAVMDGMTTRSQKGEYTLERF